MQFRVWKLRGVIQSIHNTRLQSAYTMLYSGGTVQNKDLGVINFANIPTLQNLKQNKRHYSMLPHRSRLAPDIEGVKNLTINS